jgi:hypothetical protein
MYLIKNIEEYNLLKSKKNLIAENKEIFFKLKHINIKYFYHGFVNVKSDEFKNDLATKWYRDYKHKDLFRIKKISFGKCITRNFVFETTNLIKLKVSIDKLLKKKKLIYLFNDNSNFVRLVKILIEFSSKYKNNIILLDKENKNFIGVNPLGKRGHITGFKNRFIIYFFMRFVQQFLSFFIKKKILYFRDWSSNRYFEKSNKLLISNNKNPFKSFCLYRSIFKKNFFNINSDKLLKFKLDERNIKKIFVKNNIKYNQETFELLNFIQKKLFKDNLNFILDYINIYTETINFYKPKAIIIPSADPYHFSLLIEIAKQKKCKVILSVDGYQTVKDYAGLHYDSSKKKINLDYILCPGQSYQKLLYRHKIKKNRLIKIHPPIFDNYKNLNQISSQPKYEAMIIGYIPNTRNINCLYDSYIDTELEILNIFSKLKYKNVAIKMKEGTSLMVAQQKKEESLYKDLYKKKFNKKLNIKLSFETGELYTKINSTKILVGAFSTAFVEALYNKKPFYVYEPKQNGLTTTELKSNEICNVKFILKNSIDLEKNIKTKTFFKVENGFFSGIKIQKLNKFFESILND